MGALNSKLDTSKETMQKEAETDLGNYQRGTQKTKI